MPYADIGGYSMHYVVDDFVDPWREPETILMHHGYCRNSRFWYSWVPALARHYQVVRPDARGCGDSPAMGPDFQPSLDGFVADVVGLLDVLGLEKVHYVGESFGGVIGLQLAYSHPDRVRSLVLCNTPGRLAPSMAEDYAVGYPDTSAAIDALGLEEWCRKSIDFRLDQERASPELSEWYCKEIARTDPTMAKRWLAFQPGMDFTPYLGDIAVPVLLLAPGKSKITSLEQQRMMAETIPQAELVVIENVGHGINVLEPDRCTRAVLAFLDGVSVGPR